ncbi:MAG: hypothetical protein AAF902_03985 [Chloroflexota bacterium]
MKCLYIIKFNDKAPGNVADFVADIVKIRAEHTLDWIEHSSAGMVWIVDVTAANREAYASSVREIVGQTLNELVQGADGKTDPASIPADLAPLAKYSSISFEDLIDCFTYVGIPNTVSGNNPYAIAPTEIHPLLNYYFNQLTVAKGLKGGIGGWTG